MILNEKKFIVTSYFLSLRPVGVEALNLLFCRRQGKIFLIVISDTGTNLIQILNTDSTFHVLDVALTLGKVSVSKLFL